MQIVTANLAPIVLLPLLGAGLAYAFGRSEPRNAGWIATLASFLSFIWVLRSIASLAPGVALEHEVFPWISVGSFHLDMGLRLDSLSAVMCLVVTGVGSLIHLYSIAYMGRDPSRARFFACMNLFMFAMLLLVLGASLPVLFIGWEGVGLCSYLLIGFWHTNPAFAAAGRKAFVVNRIGDAGFLLGTFLLWQHLATLDFSSLASAVKAGAELSPELLTLITLAFFVGACGKSAQIPLFVWLPDAMAGPTPVSALIHAATMVTAGVYLLARMSFLFVLSPVTSTVILLVAVATAFYAATTALVQNDIKKVLAYSTVSQLGFMFMAAAAGAYWVSVFHIITHAFFKACLFLGAGSVIMACHHEQDMRKMGGLLRKMPFTGTTYGVSVLAISGVFFFSGYQSKHAILKALEHAPYSLHMLASGLLPLISLTAVLTAFYMTRSFAMTFLGDYRGHGEVHEQSSLVTVPLVILATLAAFAGLLLDGSFGFSLQHFLSDVLPVGEEHLHEGFITSIINSWPGLLGIAAALVFYLRLPAMPGRIAALVPSLSRIFCNKWYVDELYARLIIKPLEKFAAWLWRVVDQRIVDGLVNGTGGVVNLGGEIARQTHTGHLHWYAFVLLGSSVFMLIYYLG